MKGTIWRIRSDPLVQGVRAAESRIGRLRKLDQHLGHLYPLSAWPLISSVLGHTHWPLHAPISSPGEKEPVTLAQIRTLPGITEDREESH